MIKIKDIYMFFNRRECYHCSRDISWYKTAYNRSKKIEGKYYCGECLRVTFKVCDCCDKVVNRLRVVESKRICDSCFISETHKCDRCNKVGFQLRGYDFHDICLECYNELNRSFSCINIGQRKQKSKTFIKNSRKGYCGVEIECLNDDNDKNCFIKKELNKFRFSQGTDGSLSDGGVEFRSVPMNGDLLFNSIKSFCKALNKKEYKIDRKCGLHIHLEVKRELKYLKKLYLFYLRFENMFFDMLPKSRRGISYCERFQKHFSDSTQEIISVKTLNKFKEMIYETRNYRAKMKNHSYRKRYCWANLHSIFYRGTLEIRSHSGTTNSSKIINWIMIHQKILEFLREKSLEEIGAMDVNRKNFLNIFPSHLQNYIKKRWKVFIKLEEKDLRIYSPKYIL